jgi:tetratricopeptide (TPR) repeat protein
MRRLFPRVAIAALAVLAATGAAAARADQACGQVAPPQSGGDYANPDDRQNLIVVEQYHFTANVERLVRGESGSLGADLDYTLQHFPNHLRALASLARLGLRDKTATPPGAKFSIACYFDRAIRFRPEDAQVRSIFGGYLLALGQDDHALEQLQEAARLAPENATTHYNLGLLYLKRKDYPHARESAQQAYRMGFPLPGLKNQLRAAGQWSEAD